MKKIEDYKNEAIDKLIEEFGHVKKEKIEKIVQKYIGVVEAEIYRHFFYYETRKGHVGVFESPR